MATANYDLPNDKIEEVMKISGVKTKKEALILALDEYIRRKKLETLASLKGKLKFSWTQKTLKKFRS